MASIVEPSRVIITYFYNLLVLSSDKAPIATDKIANTMERLK